LLKEVLSGLEDGALKDMVEELLPIGTKNSINVTTVVTEDDMKKEGLADEQTLWERYEKGSNDEIRLEKPWKTPKNVAWKND